MAAPYWCIDCPEGPFNSPSEARSHADHNNHCVVDDHDRDD
jgi:hypothetical protein